MISKLEEMWREAEEDKIKENEMDEIEQFKSEIQEMLLNLKTASTEELLILEKVKNVLREHHISFFSNPDTPKIIQMEIGFDNKTYRMDVSIQNGKVILRLIFPYRVQCNSIPIVAVYMAEFNSDKAFSQLNLDVDDGELTMEYAYIVDSVEAFDGKKFWVYMTSLLVPVRAVYTRLCHLSVGKVRKSERDYYKALLNQAVMLLEDDEDDNITYGTEDLKMNLSMEGKIREPILEDMITAQRMAALSTHKRILPFDTEEREASEEKQSLFPFGDEMEEINDVTEVDELEDKKPDRKSDKGEL